MLRKLLLHVHDRNGLIQRTLELHEGDNDVALLEDTQLSVELVFDKLPIEVIPRGKVGKTKISFSICNRTKKVSTWKSCLKHDYLPKTVACWPLLRNLLGPVTFLIHLPSLNKTIEVSLRVRPNHDNKTLAKEMLGYLKANRDHFRFCFDQEFDSEDAITALSEQVRLMEGAFPYIFRKPFVVTEHHSTRVAGPDYLSASSCVDHNAALDINVDVKNPNYSSGGIPLRMHSHHVQTQSKSLSNTPNMLVMHFLQAVEQELKQTQCKTFLSGLDLFDTEDTRANLIRRCHELKAMAAKSGFPDKISRVMPFSPADLPVHYHSVIKAALDKLSVPKVIFNKTPGQLRSLTRIYETTLLVMLIDSLKTLGYEVKKRQKRDYEHPFFGGKAVNIPSLPYNYYLLSHPTQEVLEIFVEPRIWLYDKAAPGDLFVVNGMGKEDYYRSPDILIRTYSKGEPKYLILDAKYTTEANVRMHEMPKMTQRYLLGFMMKTPDGAMPGVSGLWAVYPSVGRHKGVHFYDQQHDIGGDGVVVLPSLKGVIARPTFSADFRDKLAQVLTAIQRPATRFVVQSPDNTSHANPHRSPSEKLPLI